MSNPPSPAAASVLLAPLVALSVTYSCVYDWDAKVGEAGGPPMTTTTSGGTGADDAGTAGSATTTSGSGGATSTTSSIGPTGGAGGVEPACVGTPFPCGDGVLTCCAPDEYCLLPSSDTPTCVPCAPCQAQDPPCPCVLATPECLDDVATCPDASCEVVGEGVEVRCS